jgi:hypothetical protein
VPGHFIGQLLQGRQYTLTQRFVQFS